jgi:hypothetical protein
MNGIKYRNPEELLESGIDWLAVFFIAFAFAMLLMANVVAATIALYMSVHLQVERHRQKGERIALD